MTAHAEQRGGHGLPPDARLNWLGWDYTRTHDMTEETAVATRIFFAAWDQS